MDLDKTPKTPQGYYLPNENDDDWKPAWDENFKKVGTDVSEIASRNVDFADSLKKISSEMEATTKELTEMRTKATYILPTEEGWYRIASTNENVGSVLAKFKLIFDCTSAHTVCFFDVSLSFGRYPDIFQTNFVNYQVPGISRVRLVVPPVYNGNRVYVEVYKENAYLQAGNITVELTSHSNMSLIPLENGDIPVGWSAYEVTLNRGVVASNGFRGSTYLPLADNANDLGSASLRFRNIYSASGTITTSDERLKEFIKTLDTEIAIKFLKAIDSVSFKFKDGERTHFGFISQQLYEAMQAVGLSDMDFAGFIKSPIYEEGQEELSEDDREIIDYTYGIRDNEIIPVHHKVLQNLLDRVEHLENSLVKS